MAARYLTPDHLTGFEHYKYSALDTNPLSQYVMHPFWNTVVKLCPYWLAPNVLTFTGFLFTVLNFLIFSYYDYSFYASSVTHPEYPSIPNWVWLAAAFNHFMAYTLDGIDGKQARRTKSSTPLGELFDHGLDSWATILIPTCLYSVFGRADYSISPLRFYLCLWSVFFTFVSSHWEKYNTGILYLPWGYDLSQLLTFILFVFTYWKGTEFFNTDIAIFGNPGKGLEFFLHVGTYGLSLPVSLINIYWSYKNKTGKMRSMWEANRPLVSFVVFCAICLLWVSLSPNDVINQYPRCFYVMTGTVFSNICSRLIVSQMTNTRSELFNWMIYPVAISASLVLFLQMGVWEYHILHSLTALCILSHLLYGVSVVRQMCEHFNMDCFRINTKLQD